MARYTQSERSSAVGTRTLHSDEEAAIVLLSKAIGVVFVVAHSAVCQASMSSPTASSEGGEAGLAISDP